uniref:Uncharacterized protein n=1 Tax=Moniliophthora roreri TaxID=221103 RepID=A0A0W0FRS5_MONRR
MRGRPIGPFLFASIVGVVSGVYIFEPLFKEIAEKERQRQLMTERPLNDSVGTHPQVPEPPKK